MKPHNLKSRIFLDGGDPEETKTVIDKLGWLDGQTTNPTLISKNPTVQDRLKNGQRYRSQEIWDFYKETVQKLSQLIPNGSISIEVYADHQTSAEELIKQAKQYNQWIPNAHIKFPINKAGLQAANWAVSNGIRVNMTLCFTQEQGAAVYAATKGGQPNQTYLSPFIGRLDDIGLNGMDLVSNCIKMYQNGDGHVDVLAASVRTMDHFLTSLQLGANIITAPASILLEWAEKGMPDGQAFAYEPANLKQIEYEAIDLNRPWSEYNINHDLTTKGIDRFTSDWNALIV